MEQCDGEKEEAQSTCGIDRHFYQGSPSCSTMATPSVSRLLLEKAAGWRVGIIHYTSPN